MELMFVHLLSVYLCIDGALKVLEGTFTHGMEGLMVWKKKTGPHCTNLN